ncbi:enhanced intracellular survival protein Eis [Azospirillum sp. TSH100]|uniref:GNAT family N-acetyltransferase n=1 Tax=Azospirillum sp. TSH100 TaxID=652764 RepID=UPI001FFED413|nr:GNAT family N-acetyltransferase [Azospirillum sp. TSH100]
MSHPDYGPADTDELSAVARLARLGFGLSRDLFDRYADLFGIGSIRVLRVPRTTGTTLAACAACWMMNQWFGGRPVPVQAIAMVAVDPALRGAGHGSVLMRALLQEGRDAGAALALLCPATLPFYRRLGFGRGGITCRWSAPPAAFTQSGTGAGGLWPADPLDAAPLAMLRRPLLTEQNGLPERTEALWTLALCPDGEPTDLYRNEDGYIAVTPPQDRRLGVADFCLPTARALKPAMALLAGFQAQVDRVTWRGGPDDPLALLGGDGVTLECREEWLIRPLHVGKALEARGYPSDLEELATLEIQDELIFDNCSPHHLQVASSGGIISKTAQVPDPPAKLGAVAFASLFTGHASARALWRAGMLHGEEKMIERLQRVFRGAPSWMPDRF